MFNTIGVARKLGECDAGRTVVLPAYDSVVCGTDGMMVVSGSYYIVYYWYSLCRKIS